MGNKAEIRYNKSMLLRVDDEFLDALDRVRELRGQSRSEFIRRIVLDADKRARRAKS